MILRAGVKNIREIQRFRPKRFIHSEVNPKIPHWETARALTLTERLEGRCSIKNKFMVSSFSTENSISFGHEVLKSLGIAVLFGTLTTDLSRI